MRDILEILAPGAYVSGEKISEELGISRAAVWKRIEALRAQGYQIESAGKRGYRLLAGDGLEPVLWLDQLTTQALGRGEVRYEHELTSTNNVLKEMAALGAPHGSLCLCDAQTAGKGRLGRQWISPAGEGLWCSVLLRPQMKPEQAPFITLCTAMALAQAIDELCGVTVRIKWPNDLVLNGKKCVGILTELAADPDRVEYVVIGTGINLHPHAYAPELKEKAISLEEVAGKAPLRRDLLVHYLAALEPLLALLEKEGFRAMAHAYAARSCTLGSRVQVTGSVNLTGVAESLDETGALMVRTGDGVLHRVLSGDVSVRGVMGYV